jgi:hypothetical protein
VLTEKPSLTPIGVRANPLVRETSSALVEDPVIAIVSPRSELVEERQYGNGSGDEQSADKNSHQNRSLMGRSDTCGMESEAALSCSQSE